MSWEDRIREAAYTPPSGTRIRFDYQSVSREREKRGSDFEFPGVDGAYIQGTGLGPHRYRMRCFFWGSDHDLQANAFERAVEEPGTGRLEHPFYGTFDVVPLGSIRRRDDLVNAANQSVVEVTFWKTLGNVYPDPRTNRRSDVVSALETFNLSASEQFASSVDVSTVAARGNLAGTVQSHMNVVSGALSQASSRVAEARRHMADVEQAINGSIDTLVGEPLNIAEQVANFVRAPARFASGIRSRLEGYKRMSERILGTDEADPGSSISGGSVQPGRRREVANNFHASAHFMASAVAGSVESVINHQFGSRPAAISAADEILTQRDSVVAAIDSGYQTLDSVDPTIVDTGERYQAMQHAVAIATGFLVEISFTLKPERRIVLHRPRTMVDLAAELYGEVDARIDDLIDNNDLTGSEMLELPAGREIVYYA